MHRRVYPNTDSRNDKKKTCTESLCVSAFVLYCMLVSVYLSVRRAENNPLMLYVDLHCVLGVEDFVCVHVNRSAGSE